MDTRTQIDAPDSLTDPIVVTGTGGVVVGKAGQGLAGALLRPGEEPDVRAWLKSPKTRKFMGKQDRLAVIAAGRALQTAGLAPETLAKKTGLYLSVGYIPFDHTDIVTLAENSAVAGRFSMKAFSERAIETVHPLLTFRCLPNMPAFHVSVNFTMQGPYHVGYPGIGQFYHALETAVLALQEGQVAAALVGAVADQDNFLVEHHFNRLAGFSHDSLLDAAGFLTLETESNALARGAPILARLKALTLSYDAPDILNPLPGRTFSEEICFRGESASPHEAGWLGCTSLPAWLYAVLDSGASGGFEHAAKTRDGFTLKSAWELGV